MSGIDRLDLKQLRVLVGLLRERNVSRLAEQMSLTQQAVSEHLRKLRDLFEDRLFIRQGNQMLPTPRALAIGARADQLLRDIESLTQPERFSPSSYQGVFHLSVTDYALQAILPSLLRELRQEAPGLKMVVRDFKTDQIEAQLHTGEVDLALAFPDFVPPSLVTLTLFQDRHIAVAGAESPWLEQHFTLQALAALPQLVISPSKANLRGSHDDWFARQGLARNIVMSIPSFKAAPDLLYTTDMIALYPERLLPNDKVRPLQIAIDLPPFSIIAAWHPRTADSAIHQWVLKKLEKIGEAC